MLSPLLIIVILVIISRKTVMKDAAKKLLYADDLALVANGKQELQEILEKWNRLFTRHELVRMQQERGKSFRAFAGRVHIPRLAYSPSAAQPPASDRSQTALCPACKHTFALFSERARGWNTQPHRQCIKCYRGRRVRRSGTSPRVDANPPQPQRCVSYSRKCHR